MKTNLNKVYSKLPGKKRNFKSSKIDLNKIQDIDAGMEAQKNIIDDVYVKIDKATTLTEELIVLENELFDNVQEYQDARDETSEKLTNVREQIEEIAGDRAADDTVGKYFDMIFELEREFLARVETARGKGLRF